MSKNSVEIRILDERPVSWNKFYSGMHWSKRKDEADRVHALVASCCNRHQPFDNPVDISIIVGFDKRPLDPDNICIKLYIDGLKGHVIHDDTIKHIRSIKVEACKSLRAFVAIDIEECYPVIRQE